MSSLDKLSNSFHAAGTNGRLDLSLPRCASCCPTNCPCSTGSGSWIARFAEESVAPNWRTSTGWMSARTGKSSVGVGRKHPVTMLKGSLRMLRRDGLVVKTSALQSIDLGFVSQVESYQKTLKNGISRLLCLALSKIGIV